MKVATCTITRLGNKYLKEYVEYYKNLGVDKMYIYDNNRAGEENVMDVIYEYVNNGFVEVVDFSSKTGRLQEIAYQDFYENHSNEFDWCCMFDDDEYVTFNENVNIKEFLSKEMFSDKNGVAFPMINMCDSGYIVNEKDTRLDVYTNVLDLNNLYHHSFYKSIIRSGLNLRYTDVMVNGKQYTESCHIPVIDGVIGNGMVDCDGNEIVHDNSAFITRYMTLNAYLKHIPTGCIDDYLKMKRRRGWPDTGSNMNNKFNLDYFSWYNHLTPDKIEYYVEHTIKVALCVLTRLSNKYLREYIEYYKNLGIDKIYFYDNNREGEDRISDVASDFIDSGFVEIVDFTKETEGIQGRAYQDFYDKHGNEYDWICVFDDDEYLVLNDGLSIKHLLASSKFDNANGVLFPMVHYCDSGVIVNNKNTRLDVYTEVNPKGMYYLSFYKTIIRGGLEVNYLPKDEFFNTQHFPFIYGKIGYGLCDCDGRYLEFIGNNPPVNTKYTTETGFIKHISTGCIDDFINKKKNM